MDHETFGQMEEVDKMLMQGASNETVLLWYRLTVDELEARRVFLRSIGAIAPAEQI